MLFKRLGICGGSVLLAGGLAWGQQPIGSVATQDATVSGALQVTGERAVLVGSSSVTARDRAAAEVRLNRGGVVRVCQTSGVHFSAGVGVGANSSPLMLALDRGALEIHAAGVAGDAILTPDLRFSVSAPGPLDLRLRVTQNGDTCVEHRGAGAPTVVITDSFGGAMYEVHAGQHVLFEHGDLREVVDHESSPCGCPPEERKMSLAEAGIVPHGDGKDAAGEHPFPAAQSAGLAPGADGTGANGTGADVPQAPPGAVHTQVAATLVYPSADAGASATPASAAPPPAKPHGFGHAIGQFFHRLFGGG